LTTRQLLRCPGQSPRFHRWEAILKCYTEETRQQFAAVIRTSSNRAWRKLWQRRKSRWTAGSRARWTGHSQRTRCPGGGDAGFPVQAARGMELPTVERLAGGFSAALGCSSGVLVRKTPVILYVPSQGINSEGKIHVRVRVECRVMDILSLLSRPEGKTWNSSAISRR